MTRSRTSTTQRPIGLLCCCWEYRLRRCWQSILYPRYAKGMEGRPRLSGSLLIVAIQHRVGAVALDVTFRLTQPWTVLFGPSGSGKTTVLRSVAGFVRPDGGRIESASEVWFDAAAKIFVPPHRRAVRSAG